MTITTSESRRVQPTTLQEPFTYDSADSYMDLTYMQADTALRMFTSAYYDQHGLDNTGRLDHFIRRLSWMIGGDLKRMHVEDILTAWDRINAVNTGSRPWDELDPYEELLNTSVSDALSAAGIHGLPIIRRGNQ